MVDIDITTVVALRVETVEHFVMEPGIVEGQIPVESTLLTARAHLHGPGSLWFEPCVFEADVRPVAEINHVVKGRWLPTAAEVEELLVFVVELVNQAGLG